MLHPQLSEWTDSAFSVLLLILSSSSEVSRSVLCFVWLYFSHATNVSLNAFVHKAHRLLVHNRDQLIALHRLNGEQHNGNNRRYSEETCWNGGVGGGGGFPEYRYPDVQMMEKRFKLFPCIQSDLPSEN